MMGSGLPFPERQSFINPHPMRSLKIVARINKISNKRKDYIVWCKD